MTQTLTKAMAENLNDDPKVDDYFGVCPICGQHNGYLNVHKDHWFRCDAHKKRWHIGANLFSTWMKETPKQWEENTKRLEGYEEIDCADAHKPDDVEGGKPYRLEFVNCPACGAVPGSCHISDCNMWASTNEEVWTGFIPGVLELTELWSFGCSSSRNEPGTWSDFCLWADLGRPRTPVAAAVQSAAKTYACGEETAADKTYALWLTLRGLMPADRLEGVRIVEPIATTPPNSRHVAEGEVGEHGEPATPPTSPTSPLNV